METKVRHVLLRLPMGLMGPAELTELFQFEATLHGSLILCGRVILLLTLCTSQGNNISHNFNHLYTLSGAHDQD